MDLHQKFVQLGIQRKNLTRQLQALLPEIYKQQIYKQKGYFTIYEYAWKYAGFSKALVDKVIQVSRHLEDKPCLQKAVADVGIHKVALVSTIATTETDQVFANHVQNMSKAALFQFAKEIRHNGEDQKCQAVPEKIKIELDDEMQTMFLQLKKKLKKEFKREFSHKEAFRVLLQSAVKENSKTHLSKQAKPDKILISPLCPPLARPFPGTEICLANFQFKRKKINPQNQRC